MFHKICKFESSFVTNDVIMTSLPKQLQNLDLRETKKVICHSKGIDESYPKMYFLLNVSYPVKKLWAFLTNFGLFYDACSLNMIVSRDPRSKFRIFLFCPNSTFNIREISCGKALYFRNYQPKYPPRGGTPPVPLGLIALF